MTTTPRFFTHGLCSLAICLSVIGVKAQIINFDFEGATPLVSKGSSTPTLSLLGDGSHSASLVSGGPSGSGSALSLNNTGPAFATATNVTGIGGLTSFTLTSWINVSSLADTTTAFRIASTLGVGGTQGLDFSLSGTASAFKLFLGVNTTSSKASTVTADAANKWLFVAATYTSTAVNTGTIIFYTGSSSSAVTQLGTTQTITTGQGGGAVLETSGSVSSTFDIGATPATSNNRTPTMLIDNVALYGSVFDVNQLDSLRLSAVPEPATSSLIMAGLAGLAVTLRRRRRCVA